MEMFENNNTDIKNHSSDSVRKKLIISSAVLGVLLAAALIFLGILLYGESGAADELPITESTGDQTVETSELTDSDTTANSVPDNQMGTTQTESGMTTEESTEEPAETTTSETEYTPDVTPTAPTVVIPEVTLPSKDVLSLPYTIPGTDLVVERIASYDGIYLEDGSDVELTGVAMILVYNAGKKPVEYASISMKYDDKTLKFELSGLASGARVACQEISRGACSSADLVECTADVALLDSFGMAASQVSLTDNGDNTITVTNLTDQNIVTVRVFYKYYMTDENVYIGGITFTAKISNLGANESVVISPSHYASGASKVIMVRTYDENV